MNWMEREKKMLVDVLRRNVSERRNRSAWDKGVHAYAMELLDDMADNFRWADVPDTVDELKRLLLNGAADWNQYSWGGCSLCYDADIAERLCTPSELRKKKGGDLRPNSREEWLDVQARALYQAARRIVSAWKKERA